ncbi:MAG: ComEC/Rec2 family competence protein [Clostridiales bacterium]|nr:ComEC/Rec2 family competence protein [Clostridiales bacterium]
MKRIFAHIGFSFAITLVVLNFFSVKWAFVFLALSLVLFIIFMLVKKTRKAVAVPLCFACAAVAALLYICCGYGTLEAQKTLHDSSAETQFYITDLEQTSSSGATYKYTIKTKSIDIAGAPQNIKLVLYSQNSIEADYYEVIKANLSFYEISDNAYSSNGYFGKNIFTSAYTYSYELTGDSVRSPLKYVLYAREYIHELFNDILGQEYGGIAVALITGDKSGISEEHLDNFRAAGVVHLLAVSGLHISVLIGTLYWLLKRIGMPKLPQSLIPILFALFYIALSGFSKSIIRAGIMVSVMLIARLFNERSDTLNSLGIAVFIICLNPFAVTDVSAQLTVTAVLGILAVYPHLRRRIKLKTKLFEYPLRIFLVSVSIFITTFPSMYIFFGTVSTVGAFVNIIMIPVGECALVLSTLLLLFSKISFLCSVIAFLDSVFIRLMLLVTEKASSLSFAVADIRSYAAGLAIGAVLLVFGAAFLMGRKKALKSAAIFSAVLMFCVVCISNALNQSYINMRVVSGYSSDAVIIYNNESAVVIGVQEYSQYYTVQQIVHSNGLYISLLIDSPASSYSQKLSQKELVISYVTADVSAEKGVGIMCENLVMLSDFETQSFENLTLQYSPSSSMVDICIYDTAFSFDLSSASSGFDTIYSVNKYGYSEMRINEWLQ